MAMNLRQKIDELYNKSRSKNYVHNVNYLYSILQIKMYNSTLRDYTCTFYKDIKSFVNNYVLAMEQEGYGYDVISVDKILNVIQKLDSIEERSKILQFVYLKLKKAELDEECHIVQKEQKALFIKSVFKADSCILRIKGIVYCLFYNIWTILVISILLMLSYYLITLPLMDVDDAWFVVDGKCYSGCLYSNHFLNIAADAFGLDDGVYCQPNSGGAIFIAVLYKILGALVISGCLWKYLGKYLYLKILEYED